MKGILFSVKVVYKRVMDGAEPPCSKVCRDTPKASQTWVTFSNVATQKALKMETPSRIKKTCLLINCLSPLSRLTVISKGNLIAKTVQPNMCSFNFMHVFQNLYEFLFASL